MTTKVLLFLLSLSLCLATLAGCQPAGGSSSNIEDSSIDSESSSDESFVEPFTPSADSVAIRWAVNEIADLITIDGRLDKFNQLLHEKGHNFHLKVVLIPFAEDAAEFNNQIKEMENIDIASCSGSSASLIQEGFFAPLDEYLMQDSGKALRELYSEIIWEAARIQERIYCIPNGYGAPTSLILALNKNYISQELIDGFSGNFTDLDSILASLDGEGYTKICYDTTGIAHIPGVLSELVANIVILPSDGSSAQSPTQFQPLVDHMRALNRYYKAKSFKYHTPTLTDYPSGFSSAKVFEDRLYAVHLSSYAYRSQINLENMVVFELCDAYQSAGLGSIGITSTSAHKEEAFALLQALYTDADLANCLTYGIEGRDYVIQENGCATVPGIDLNDMDSVDPALITPPYFSTSYFFGVYDSAAPVYNEVEGNNRKEAKQKYFENEVVQSPYLGKYFDPTGYEEILAEVTAIWDENCDLIWQSDDFEAELARVDALLQDAGIDTLIAAVNEQYGIAS